METGPQSTPGNRWWYQTEAAWPWKASGVKPTLTPVSASASRKKFYSESWLPLSSGGFSLLSLDMATHQWNRLLGEQSARCSCFTKISRHHVGPVTAARRLGWDGNPASYPCTVQGPAFPDCCPKAAGPGTGGLLLEQEKEGVPFPQPSPMTSYHHLGCWPTGLEWYLQLFMKPLWL